MSLNLAGRKTAKPVEPENQTHEAKVTPKATVSKVTNQFSTPRKPKMPIISKETDEKFSETRTQLAKEDFQIKPGFDYKSLVTEEAKRNTIMNIRFGDYEEVERMFQGVYDANYKAAWPENLIPHSDISPFPRAISGLLKSKDYPPAWRSSLPTNFEIENFSFNASPVVQFRFEMKQTVLTIFGINKPHKMLGRRGGYAKEITNLFKVKGISFPHDEDSIAVKFAVNDRYMIQKGAILYLACHLHNHRNELPCLKEAPYTKLIQAVVMMVGPKAFAYPLASVQTALVAANVLGKAKIE